MKYAGLSAAIALLLCVLASVHDTKAQTPSEYQIVIAAPPGQRFILGQQGSALAVANGKQVCTNGVGNEAGDMVFRIGLSGQPVECMTDGTPVAICSGMNTEIISTQPFVIRKGMRQTVSFMGPVPPHAGLGCPGNPPLILSGPYPNTPPSYTPIQAGPAQILVPPNTGDAGLAATAE